MAHINFCAFTIFGTTIGLCECINIVKLNILLMSVMVLYMFLPNLL